MADLSREQLVRALARRLTTQYDRSFSYPSVKRMKQSYLTFPRGPAPLAAKESVNG